MALALALVGGASGSAVSARSFFPGCHDRPTNRMAVLPFDNLGDSADAPFADGISDAVRDKLAALRGPRRRGAQQLGSIPPDREAADQIGRELGVNYLLTGTVRWAKTPGHPNRLLIRTRLMEAATGTEQWAEPLRGRSDRRLPGAVRDSDARAQVLGVTLDVSERELLAGRPTRSLAAYGLYLQARGFLEQRTPVGLRMLRATSSWRSGRTPPTPRLMPGWRRHTSSSPTTRQALRPRQFRRHGSGAAGARAGQHDGSSRTSCWPTSRHIASGTGSTPMRYRRGIALNPERRNGASLVRRLSQHLAGRLNRRLPRSSEPTRSTRSHASSAPTTAGFCTSAGDTTRRSSNSADPEQDPDFATADDWLGMAYLLRVRTLPGSRRSKRPCA